MDLFKDILEWSATVRPHDTLPSILLRALTTFWASAQHNNAGAPRSFPLKALGEQSPMFTLVDFTKICVEAERISTYVDLRTRALFYFAVAGFRPSSILALELGDIACSKVEVEGSGEPHWSLLVFFCKLKSLSNKVCFRLSQPYI